MAPRRTKAELAAELAATQKRLAQLERTQARQAKALRAAQQVEAAEKVLLRERDVAAGPTDEEASCGDRLPFGQYADRSVPAKVDLRQ